MLKAKVKVNKMLSNLMNGVIIKGVIALLMAGAVALSGVAQAADMPDGPYLITTGSARIAAVPDMATLSIEVSVSASSAASAKQQADKRMAEYLAFLKKNQIDQQDISSANLRTLPEYDYGKGVNKLKGYRAVRNVEVKLRQLDKLNDLLDGALNAGLSEILSVRLGVAQPEQYQQKARNAAIANAISQAQQLAQGFDSKLGGIYRIRYHDPARPTADMASALSLRANAPGAAESGYSTQTIYFTDQVEAVFRLAQ